MKKLLLSLFVLSSLTCFAGSSAEDPIVKEARQKFASAKAPNLKFLVDNKFQCTVLYALKGMFDKVSSGQKTFKWDAAANSLKTTEWNNFKTFLTLDQDELWGIGTLDKNFCSVEVAYRMTKNNELISETASKWCFNANEVDQALSPNSKGKVLYYTVCKLKG